LSVWTLESFETEFFSTLAQFSFIFGLLSGSELRHDLGPRNGENNIKSNGMVEFLNKVKIGSGLLVIVKQLNEL
jgi:hypothetical protein